MDKNINLKNQGTIINVADFRFLFGISKDNKSSEVQQKSLELQEFSNSQIKLIIDTHEE